MRMRGFEDMQLSERSTFAVFGPRGSYGMDISQDCRERSKEYEERGTTSVPAGRTIIGPRGSFSSGLEISSLPGCYRQSLCPVSLSILY